MNTRQRNPLQTLNFFISLVTLALVAVHLVTPSATSPSATTPSATTPSATTPSNPREQAARTCEFPIVYNKPHKTGSTTLQHLLLRWARRAHRVPISCSAYLRKASMQLRECIPAVADRCAVVATHLELDTGTRELLRQRLGGEMRTITSTRDPTKRIVSLYLQTVKAKAAMVEAQGTEDLRRFVRGMNPWELYNYHTGEARTGTCPMEDMEKRVVATMVKHYDVVVDVDLWEVSMKILGAGGVSAESKRRRRLNPRGGGDIVLDAETREAINGMSCVEEEMHHLFRLRMASLYGNATGKTCLTSERYPRPCFG